MIRTLYSGLSARSRPFFFALPVLNGGQRLVPDDFLYIVGNAVFIAEFPDGEAAVLPLAPVGEQQIRVDDGLPPENVPEELVRNLNVGEYIQIRLPPGPGAGFFLGGGLLF